MAINLNVYEVYVLDTGEGFNVSRKTTGKYLRYAPPLCPAAWYYLDDNGYIDSPVYQSDWLEDIYKESNGFLGQRELF